MYSSNADVEINGNLINSKYNPNHFTEYDYNNFNELTHMRNCVSWNDNSTVHNSIKESFFEYDEKGNMTKKQTDGESEIFAYNSANQLTEYTDETGKKFYYTYYPNGLRKSKYDERYFDMNSGVFANYRYDQNGKVINEYVPHNENPIKTYRWGAEGLKYSSEFKGEMIVSDYRGDVLNAFSNGVNGYNAYGEEQKKKIKESSLGYCGEYTDSESGLIYLKNRYYDPEISRFITEDPIYDGDNWYVYCKGNPVNRVDPNGLYYIEKDLMGQVYAVIEYGDTLSKISYSEVLNVDAYLNLNYAEPGYLEIGQRVNITEIYNESHPIPTNIALSKTSHTQGDSGLRDVSDEEVSSLARNKSLPPEERRRYQREEKLRGNRNKQKRQSHYSKQQSQFNYYNNSFVRTASQHNSKVNIQNNRFWNSVEIGIITIVGISAGIYYFCYSGDPSVIYQYVR